jgi:hypothetical protein
MVRTMIWGLAGICIALVALSIWVRVASIDGSRFTATPGPDAVGNHTLTGGAKSVRSLTDLPSAAFEKLLAVIEETPHTTRIGTGTAPAAYVTRSRAFGFPDVTVVWVADGNLHVHGHLVYGASDVGVNSARIGRWLDAVGQR